MAKGAKPKAPKVKADRKRYGIGEWFGEIVSKITPQRRRELSKKSTMGVKAANMLCPFRQLAFPGAICNKKGGVCTLQQYVEAQDGSVSVDGGFVTMCPNRFWQNNDVFRWIGDAAIGSKKPFIVKEVDFLNTIITASDVDPDVEGEVDEELDDAAGDAVGRIDMVLMHPDDPSKWCTVEVQAVYFSGAGMLSHLTQFGEGGMNHLPFPDKIRRPDFRSSGPKRLMPQLQTKVPTLRRWGKKMFVVIDAPFRQSLGGFTKIDHLSNCDIVWFVIDYDTDTGNLFVKEKIYTTLESSVDALTAGIPRSLEEFQSKIQEITSSPKKAKSKLVKIE